MAKNIQISELDFSSIKSSIIDYMKNDPTFKDYDFQGSGLSTLTDLLSYNTYYNSFYLNMVSNEMFLDTARLRDNVVAKSKLLGYTPTSVRAAEASLSCTFEIYSDYENSTEFGTIKIDNSFMFSKSNSQTYEEYKFVPKVSRSVNRVFLPEALNDGSYKHTYEIFDLEVLQGTVVEEKMIVDTTDPNQKFLISNSNVDTSTLKVFLQSNVADSTYTEYKVSTDTMALTDISKCYFLQESYDEKFEILFGDGVLGASIQNGNIVTMRYLISSGSEANGMTGNLKLVSSNRNIKASAIQDNLQIIGRTYGGSDKETVESIKFFAPRTFEGQNRAVTARDYQTIIPKIYPQASSVNIWGGEDAVPPQYGKVFISIKPNSGFYVSSQEKIAIQQNLVKNYSVLTLTPEIIDPDFIKLKISTQVKFDNESTLFDTATLQQTIKQSIIDYDLNMLNDFNSYFRYSQFLAKIDQTDESITNNLTEVLMINEKEIYVDTASRYIFNFSNALTPSTMYSNGFYITGDTSVYYLDDNGLGKVRFYTLLPSGDKVYNSLYSGSVNYDTGAISLANISISSIVGAGQLGIVVKPLNNDIFPVRNQIILLDLDELSIQMLEDTDEYNENYEVSSQRVQVTRNITTTYSDGQYSAGISSGATSGTVSQRVYSESPSGGSSSGGSSSGGSSSGGSSSGGGY
jgi:hypothetical protein